MGLLISMKFSLPRLSPLLALSCVMLLPGQVSAKELTLLCESKNGKELITIDTIGLVWTSWFSEWNSQKVSGTRIFENITVTSGLIRATKVRNRDKYDWIMKEVHKIDRVTGIYTFGILWNNDHPNPMWSKLDYKSMESYSCKPSQKPKTRF